MQGVDHSGPEEALPEERPQQSTVRIVAASLLEGLAIVVCAALIFYTASYLIEKDPFDAAPLVLMVLYPLPIFIAEWRKHNRVLDIMLTNLWLGWTIIGWIVALIWACDWDVETQPE